MPSEMTSKILFVDDEKNVLDAISRQLRTKFDVTTALGPVEGLKVFKEQGPFAVVVSDLKMPEMNGMEFLTKIRQIAFDVVCVVLTGYADLEVAITAVNERKIYRFLTKPCPTDNLITTLRECLANYQNILKLRSFTYSARIENDQFKIRSRSYGCSSVTGYTPHDFENDPELWHSIVKPQYKAALQDYMDTVLSGKEAAPLEYEIIKRNNDVRWIRETIIPHKNDDGVLVRCDGYIEDITESKDMEIALKKSEARYQKIVSNVPGLVFQMVRHSEFNIEFAFVSESANELFSIGPEHVMANSDTLFDMMNTTDRQEFNAQVEKSAAEMVPLQWTGKFYVHQKVKWFQCMARPEMLENGKVMWDGLYMDVTALRQAEEHARQLAKFPSENPNPVLRISDDGKIIFANKASDPLLKLWDKEVNSTLPENMYELARKVKATGTHDCIEVRCQDRYFSMVFAPIDEFGYVNIYARDITEVKLAEMELIRANEILKEHDRLKSEFVSTVSHELRTPLCIFKNIISNTLAGVMGKISKELRSSLVMADKSVERLSRIVADFLDISKIESGSLKLNLKNIHTQTMVQEVTDSLRTLASAKDVQLDIQAPSEPVHINADQDRIVQVLTNLIGNAIKFIDSGGKITVGIIDQGEDVEFLVEDNGPGLDKEQLEKIFDRFVQVHFLTGPGEHGTGLGLTIAKELVEMHSGRLWADSVINEGSCFHFSLPKAGPANDQLLSFVTERFTQKAN